MFKLIDSDKKVLESEVSKSYPGCAYIMTDIEEREDENGVMLECAGLLYAVCDRDGLEKLYDESIKLKNSKCFINTNPLDDGIGVYE